jgi:glutaredoxin
MSELSELELEKKKLEYPIVFYYMTGCPHCDDAERALDPLIKSGVIGPFKHTQKPPAGVQGFPHFVNNKNGKTVTGWPGSEEELFRQLGYIKENFTNGMGNVSEYNLPPHKREQFSENYLYNKNPYMDTNVSRTLYARNFRRPPIKRENFEMENSPSYPVVERMDTIPTDVLYHHQAGGYLPLNKCWVKQPDYTA